MLLSWLAPKWVHHIRIRSYASVNLEHRSQLPRKPGIYYAISDGKLLYVGLSKNLFTRWNGREPHHKLAVLKSAGRVKLHYKVMPVWRIAWVEAKEIQRFAPPLNIRKESIRGNLNGQIVLWGTIQYCFEFGLLMAIGLSIALLLSAL